MARMRYIKPGFFTNDELGDLNPLARILFAGLWCHADRRGRLEDRPKKLKAEVLPYDNCDIDELLDMLRLKGFIERYEVSGTKYIQIITFHLHQSPNVRENESIIPAPYQNSTCTSLTEADTETDTGTGTETEAGRAVQATSTTASPLAPLPSLETVKQWATDLGRPEEAEGFHLKMTERGWVTFGQNPVPIRGPDAAHAALKRWIVSADRFITANGTHSNPKSQKPSENSKATQAAAAIFKRKEPP